MSRVSYGLSQYEVNQVIQISSQNEQQSNFRCILLPAYLRVKVKGISELNVGSLNGQIKLLIILSIFYGDRQYLLEDIKHNLRLQIFQNQTLDLSRLDGEQTYRRGSKSYKQSIQNALLRGLGTMSEGKVILRHDLIQRTLTYLIDMEVKVKLQPQVALTPLQYINTKFKVCLIDFYIKKRKVMPEKPENSVKIQELTLLKPQKKQKRKEATEHQKNIKSEQIVKGQKDQIVQFYMDLPQLKIQRMQSQDAQSQMLENSVHHEVVNYITTENQTNTRTINPETSRNNVIKQFLNFGLNQNNEKEEQMKKKQKLQVINVKFNFMNSSKKFEKIYFEDGITLGDYDLAESNLQIIFYNQMKDRNAFYYFYDLQINRMIKEKEKIIESVSNYWKRKPIDDKPKQELFNMYSSILILLQGTISMKHTAAQLSSNNYHEEAQRMLKDKILIEKAFLSQKQIQNIRHNYKEMDKEELIINLIQHMENYNIAIVYVPFYREPISMIITLLIPFLMLGLINLGIFFQCNNISNRMACIATILVAFNAFLPAFRQQLPAIPKVTLVEFLIILQVLTCLLCGIQSLSIRDIQDYKFVWREDSYYLLALFITIINLLVIIGMALLHWCYLRPKYNDYEDNKHSRPFIRSKWFNQPLAKCINEIKCIEKHVKVKFDLPKKKDQMNPRVKKQIEKQIEKVQKLAKKNQPHQQINYEKYVFKKVIWLITIIFLSFSAAEGYKKLFPQKTQQL